MIDYNDLKEIPGFSRYRCNPNTGEVFSVVWKFTQDGTPIMRKQPLKRTPQLCGQQQKYLQMVLMDDEGKYRFVMLSHIVWASVHGHFPPQTKQIHHKDKDPANNAISNLSELSQLQHLRLHQKLQREERRKRLEELKIRKNEK